MGPLLYPPLYCCRTVVYTGQKRTEMCHLAGGIIEIPRNFLPEIQFSGKGLLQLLLLYYRRRNIKTRRIGIPFFFQLISSAAETSIAVLSAHVTKRIYMQSTRCAIYVAIDYGTVKLYLLFRPGKQDVSELCLRIMGLRRVLRPAKTFS